MYHEQAVFEVCQRPAAQPVEPVFAVGGKQDVVEGVGASLRAHAGGDAEQVDVVVAENDACACAERVDLLQHAEVVAAAIDQVAAEPDVGGVGNLREQAAQRVGAALYVADDVEIGCGGR